MRRILFELYLTSSFFLVVAGILIGRLSYQLIPAAESTPHLTSEAGSTPQSTTETLAGIDLREEISLGSVLFKNQCASCHNKNMRDDLTGPALGGVENRWSSYPSEDLYSWIRNSQALVAKGHPRATALLNEWKQVMPAFTNLSDVEIAALLAYVEARG